MCNPSADPVSAISPPQDAGPPGGAGIPTERLQCDCSTAVPGRTEREAEWQWAGMVRYRGGQAFFPLRFPQGRFRPNRQDTLSSRVLCGAEPKAKCAPAAGGLTPKRITGFSGE